MLIITGSGAVRRIFLLRIIRLRNIFLKNKFSEKFDKVQNSFRGNLYKFGKILKQFSGKFIKIRTMYKKKFSANCNRILIKFRANLGKT